MTDAHVIPRAVGGRLSLPCLCFGCNSSLGSSVEAKLTADPCIRWAIEAVYRDFPEAVAKMRKGRLFVAHTKDALIRATARENDYRILESPQPDGSRVKDPERAREEIATALHRRGLTNDLVAGALAAHDGAEPGVRVAVAPGITIRRGSVETFEPYLGEDPVRDECPLAIAYLFLAACLGPAIYDPRFQAVRSSLLGYREDGWSVVPCRAIHPYEPWHGLCLDTKQPHLAVQIRLFGQVAWVVHLTAVPLPPSNIVNAYQLDLVSGEERTSTQR